MLPVTEAVTDPTLTRSRRLLLADNGDRTARRTRRGCSGLAAVARPLHHDDAENEPPVASPIVGRHYLASSGERLVAKAQARRDNRPMTKGVVSAE